MYYEDLHPVCCLQNLLLCNVTKAKIKEEDGNNNRTAFE